MAKKMKVTVREYDKTEEIVGVWLSQQAMDEIGVKAGDFIYASVGWSGSKSFRAVVKGLLPDGFADDEMPATPDRLYEGNMKDGEQPKIWLHNNWQ